MRSPPEEIEISQEGLTLPVMDVMTGRGFITGKSGSGKSNTASVIAEELLESGLTVVIVDTDGEYFGLKQEYELLHVGGDDTCDVQVTEEHGEELARLAIEENVPIILDVSAYLDPSKAETLIESVIRNLFVLEKSKKKPLLVFVEEVHEYIPEKGGLGDLGQTLVQVAKRGRKRGLGVCGMSQRPAAVDKDFITQCNWIAWHRLTWETDTDVIGRIMDSKYSESVQNLNDGEAFLMTDWDEKVRRITFRRKKTFDAGATPGLEDYDPPDMTSVRSDLIAELQSVGEEDEETESPPDAPAEPGDEQLAQTPKTRTDGIGHQSAANATPPEGSTTRSTRRKKEPPEADRDIVEFAFMIAYAFDWLIETLSRKIRSGVTKLLRGMQSKYREIRYEIESVLGDDRQKPPEFSHRRSDGPDIQWVGIAIIVVVFFAMLLIGLWLIV